MYTFQSSKKFGDKLDDAWESCKLRIWKKIQAKAEEQNAKDAERERRWEQTERFLQETALFSYLAENREHLTQDERELFSILYGKFSAEYSLPVHFKPEFESSIEERISNAIQRYDLDIDSRQYRSRKKTLIQRIHAFFKEDDYEDYID